MPTSTWTIDEARDTVADWLDAYRETGGTLGPLAKIEAFAADAAHELKEVGRAEVMYQPGNLTNYSLALTLLPDGPAGAWGGPLLVAMPEWDEGGRACAFGLGYELDPRILANELRIRHPDAVAVAALLTLVSVLLGDS